LLINQLTDRRSAARPDTGAVQPVQSSGARLGVAGVKAGVKAGVMR